MPRPLDVIARDFLAPVLVGFTRSGRLFHRHTDRGDVVSVELRSYAGQPDGLLTYGAVSAAGMAYQRAHGASERHAMSPEGGGLFSRRLTLDQRPHAVGDMWCFDPEDPDSIGACGELMAATLHESALPVLDRCQTREGIREFLRSIPENKRTSWGFVGLESSKRLFALDTAPPEPLLAELAAEIGVNPFTEWAISYLHNRMETDDSANETFGGTG